MKTVYLVISGVANEGASSLWSEEVVSVHASREGAEAALAAIPADKKNSEGYPYENRIDEWDVQP
jgi:hypothetical protein